MKRWLLDALHSARHDWHKSWGGHTDEQRQLARSILSGLIDQLDRTSASEACAAPNREEPGSTPGPVATTPRPKVTYVATYPVTTAPCRWCTLKIVWLALPSGAGMPLSHATRVIEYDETGKDIGLRMQPHFGDCANWPKKKSKKL